MAYNDIRIPKGGGIDLRGSSIELAVGPNPPITFCVHEKLVCASSDYFKTIMSGSWKESQERLVRLEDDEPDIVQVYLHWLYRGTLPTRVDEPGLAGNSEYLQLAKAYVLGDKLQDSDFKDTVVDAMIHKCKSSASDGNRWHPVGLVVNTIYDNTPESSKARRLLVDIYVHSSHEAWLTDYWAKEEDIPSEFLYDLTIGLLRQKGRGTKGIGDDPSTMSSTCAYHQHGSDSRLCYKARMKSEIVGKTATIDPNRPTP